MDHHVLIRKKIAEDYWVGKLAGAKGCPLTPAAATDAGRAPGLTRLNVPVCAQLAGHVSKVCKGNKASIYKLFAAALAVLNWKSTGAADIVLATPPFRVPQAPADPGCLLFLRIRVGEMTVRELLQLLNDQLNEACKHQSFDYPAFLERFSANRLGEVPDLLRQGFAYSGFNHACTPFAGLDLQWNLLEEAGGWVLAVAYDAARYDGDGVARFGERLLHTVRQLTDKPGQSIGRVEITPPAEKEWLLAEAARYHAPYPEALTAIEWFEEQVEKTPGAVALVGGEERLTYDQLNQRVNRLTHRLLTQYRVKPGELVALMMDRSQHLVIAALAILKAGAAYVPLDPDYPAAQKESILADSGSRLLLTEPGCLAACAGYAIAVLDATDVAALHAQPATNPVRGAGPRDLAYVIYTSGTTGKPKGVMIEHRGVTNLLHWQNKAYDFATNTNILQLTNFVVDIAIIEVFTALVNGLTVFVPSREVVMNSHKLVAYIEAHQINFLQIVPDMLKACFAETGKVASLNLILCGGDKLSQKLKDNIVDKGYLLYDNYGQTEITVDVLISRCAPGKAHFDDVVQNLEVYILDEYHCLQPSGVTGELCISGPGVARGYWCLPELNAQKFIPHPFREGQVLYKTGDLGRRRPDGGIELLGRNDAQVKINGYRVELGAVEKRLASHPAVDEAVVVAREAGERYLAAYLTLKTPVARKALMDHLLAQFPGYMVPAHFVFVERFPLNANGKIDKKALPDPLAQAPAGQPAFLPPGTAVEKAIAGIWQDVLGVSPVGATANFFEAGGNSLKVIQVVSRMYKELGQEVPVRNFFADPTVRGLARYLESQQQPALAAIPRVPPGETYPVSHAQLRLWIMDQFEEERTAYHMSAAYLVEGLVPEAFQWAVALLVGHYEILRTTFVADEGGAPAQKIHPPDAVMPSLWQSLDLAGETDPEGAARRLAVARAEEAYDLEKGPLFRTLLMRIAPGRHVVVLAMHHIISDGWSMEVMVKELLAAYAALQEGKEPRLAALPVQYKDFAAWHNQLLAGAHGTRLRAYWTGKLAGPLPLLGLPTDYGRPAVRTNAGAAVDTVVGEALTARLNQLSARHRASLFMTVTAGITVLLHRHSGQDDLILGTPNAGRSHPDLADQIGCFLNPVPMRMQVSRNQSFREVLAHVSQTCLDMYEYHLYPFDKLVEDLQIKRIPGRSPLFDAGLTWQSSILSGSGNTQVHGLQIARFLPEAIASKNDLWFYCSEAGGRVYVTLVYDVRLFREATIRQLAADLVAILEQVTQDEEVALIDLALGEATPAAAPQPVLSLQLNL